MERPDSGKLKTFQEKPRSSPLTREMVFLAEQAAEGDLKVLPGDGWALHYPSDPQVREEKLQGLMDGKYTSEEVEHYIKPDALFYDIKDIESHGLEKVSAQIRDLSSFIAHYDYSRFTSFVENMRGREVPVGVLEDIYADVMRTRSQKKVMDAYGHTGKKQMEIALRREADGIVRGIESLPRSQKVLKALKMSRLEELGLVSSDERDQVVADLSGDERAVFESLHKPYNDYVQNGDESAYEELIQAIQKDFPAIQKPVENQEQSESMRELDEELREFRDQVGLPGSSEDPAIPPEDDDEYHTPPPSGADESKEKMPEKAIFRISPPLAGYYASGRKSYFNIESKTWSKKKQLSSYELGVVGEKRFTISGVLEDGLKSLPVPNGYALDSSSLKAEGAKVKIFRDQNGCFYLDVKGRGSFSVDFSAEEEMFNGPPVPEDTAPLHRGSLSSKTEAMIAKLTGSPIHKAEQARQHILATHFYPGGGDLQTAQALQYKLRSESTGDDYLQNIDQSEYLECYSANTKFIAMMRRADIPARLVIGYKVTGAKDGESAITPNNGHAWSEIWDGKAWRRFDATPNPKPEDQKDGDQDRQESSETESAEEAQDGGVEGPREDKQKEGGKGDQSKGGEDSQDAAGSLDQMNEASDVDLEQSESQLQHAKEQVDRAMEEKQQLDSQAESAESFKELSELQKKVEESDIFDDMKEELIEKLSSKEEQMKDQIKDELDRMVEDGFMDEDKRDEILQEMDQKKLEELDRVQKEVERENQLYGEYEDIRQEVMPLVDTWFKYFAERLPRHEDVGFDEDSLTRQGSFSRRAVMRSRNLLFGTVKNPREVRSSIKPRFMASLLMDVSGSMDKGGKLKSARKLLVFYSELFSRISEAFGYIRFSIHIFSDSVTEIKGFDQDYDAPTKYEFDDGSSSTIKVRLMQKLKTQGGTNMLEGIKRASKSLSEQTDDYPDYASAFYFVGDGGDTCGNAENIRRFLAVNDSEHGFGEHMYSATLLGNESQRRELADIFGDEHTNVAPDLEELIERSMQSFEDDMEEYLRGKVS